MLKLPLSLAVLCMLFLSIDASATTFTFTLSNVKLSDGGTLTGSFVADSAYSLYSTNILASSNGAYTGYRYNTSSPSTVNEYSNYLPNYLDYELGNQVGNQAILYDVLHLDLTNFTINGGSIATTSYEQELTGGTRYVVSGSITSDAPPPVATTPEPSSVVLLGTGVLGILGAARRRLGLAT